jgi:hypothetical protein
MLIGCRELIELCVSMGRLSGWDELPSEHTLYLCWREAKEIAGNYPSAITAAAAIFYSLSRNAGSLGDACVQFPSMVLVQQLAIDGLKFAAPDAEAVRRMQNDIDDLAPFDDVVAWLRAQPMVSFDGSGV